MALWTGLSQQSQIVASFPRTIAPSPQFPIANRIEGWWFQQRRRAQDRADSDSPLDPAPTGSDGDLQKGVAWPNPRFTDNANGTVTDNLTGLIWLKNANCFGRPVWTARGTCTWALARRTTPIRPTPTTCGPSVADNEDD